MRDTLKLLVWPVAFMLLAAFAYTMRIQYEMPDFEAYFTAASRVLRGQPLYVATDATPFAHLPVVAMAMAPFALLGHDGAKVAWFALSVGLLTALVRWSVHALPERRRSDQILPWLTVAVMLPFYVRELTMGQTDVLLGVLLMGSLLAAQIDVPRVAGFLLGVAIILEPYAVLLLPWLVMVGGRSGAMTTTMVLAAGLLLPVGLYGWDGNVAALVAWYRTMSVANTNLDTLTSGASLTALWTNWLGLTRLAITVTIITSTALLGLAAAVWSQRRRVLNPEYLDFAIVLLLIPLVSVRSPDYMLLLATPAVACLLDRISEIPRVWRWAAGIALVLLAASALEALGPVQRWMEARGVGTVAALGVCISLALVRWKRLA